LFIARLPERVFGPAFLSLHDRVATAAQFEGKAVVKGDCSPSGAPTQTVAACGLAVAFQ
jgi:hypothetical protein